jgi:hypothetical protein
VGAGIPEYEAKLLEEKLRHGNVLVSVHTDDHDQQETARSVLEDSGAEDIGVTTEKSAKG